MRPERGVALRDADAEAELDGRACASLARARRPRRASRPPACAARSRRVGAGQRIVEEHHHAVAGEALERALVVADQRAERVVIFAQQLHDVLGLGGLGEGGEAAQVAEQRHDLAAMAVEHALVARRDDQPRRAAARGSAAAGRCARARRAGRRPWPRGPCSARCTWSCSCLDAQHRAHPRHQRAMVDRLGEIVVAAGFEPGDDVLRRRPWRSPG